MIIDTIKIYAIVVTYNGEQWIEKCLSSLQESSIPVAVIAVDNCSTDNTVGMIRQKFSSVDVIETGKNLGFGRANNIGIKKALEAKADYVFLLNQDAWVEKNTVETLATVAARHGDYGIISPFHFNWAGSKVDHYFLRMASPDTCADFLSDSFLKNQRDIYQIEFIHAACWLISRKCLEEVGGFDPLFSHYGEDNDYVIRARIKSLQTGIVPAVNVYHAGFFDPSKSAENNIHLQTIHALLDLKKMGSSMRVNYFLYIKERLDSFSTLFLTTHFKKSFRELKLALIPFKYYSRIKLARKLSGEPKAFLQ